MILLIYMYILNVIIILKNLMAHYLYYLLIYMWKFIVLTGMPVVTWMSYGARDAAITCGR